METITKHRFYQIRSEGSTRWPSYSLKVFKLRMPKMKYNTSGRSSYSLLHKLSRILVLMPSGREQPGDLAKAHLSYLRQ
jgi:hypothetical protein